MAEATNFAKSQLKALVERIERLEEEKKALADDIREVYGEAKASGFDVKALREVIRLRAKDDHERKEYEAIVDLYKEALGLTPLEALAARPQNESVANPPFAHTAPKPDEDMPAIPDNLRRNPELDEPRVAAE